MRSTLGTAISAIAVALVLAGCGGAPVSRTAASPSFDVSTTPAPTPLAAISPAATPSPTQCQQPEPLPGLCGVGRQATADEFAAMLAAGRPAIERAYGWKDWSACANGETCFKAGDITASMVGTNAGSFTGGDGLYPSGGLGSACWVFLSEDAGGWHYVNSGCAQNPGFVPGLGAHVYVTGCANVRSGPGLSAKVIGCLGNGSIVDVDSAPTYLDGHIWWHLAGRGWMAHDFLVLPGPGA
jgi:hypothetical protein